MNKRIVQLPPAIANQIAAGEVIERPASVVKELLENSLDAEATQINIELNYGGLNQIKISDNGVGIMAEDLPLAIAAHATSKIANLNDLYSIRSMGFRGEALASIASIARLSISSKPANQEHAMLLSVQGVEYIISPCARATGTTIEVNDLFFNAPVRKRFLKSERLEFQAIEAVVKRFALSAPHIALTLNHNNKVIFALPAALNAQAKQIRMTKILGTAFVRNALFLNVEHSAMQLQGWISGIEHQRSQNDRQWVYINQRMVKDKLINHALKQAYDGIVYPGRFPSCVLYFTMNPNEIDVNVHPTKHEVRFQQPRLVHDFFVAQLSKALAAEQKSTESSDLICEPEPQFALHSSYKEYYAVSELKSPLVNARAHTGTNVYDLNTNDREELYPPLTAKRNDLDKALPWTSLTTQFSVVWIKQLPYLVDVTALYKAWLQQQLEEHLPLASRPLLVSIRYPLSVQLEQKVPSLQHDLLSLGLTVELHNKELLIRSVPVSAPYLDLKTFFERIAEPDGYSFLQLQNTFCDAQLISSQQLTSEERIALSHYLITLHNEKRKPVGVAKQLTEEDCRMLLHV